MRQIKINQYEKVVSQDMNDMQFAQAKSLNDDVIYNFFGTVAQGVLGSSFTASYLSAFSASLLPGAGFFYDSSQTGVNPKNRMIESDIAIPVTIAANTDPTNSRIDYICLAPNLAVLTSVTRFLKTGGTGPIAATVVQKSLADNYLLQVVVGTPSSSPAAPAVPAGYIPIAQVVNRPSSAGMSGIGAVTDHRTVLSLSISNAGHVVATGTTIQAQLDELDAVAKLPSSATRTVTSNTAIISTDGMIRSDTSSGNLTHTLPTVASTPIGKTIVVKDVGAGTSATTVKGNGSEIIDGLNTYGTALVTPQSLTVRNNGTSWDVI